MNQSLSTCAVAASFCSWPPTAMNGALISVWPIIEVEHWLPFYPLAVVAGLGLLPAKVVVRRLAAAALTIELIFILRLSAPWLDQVKSSTLLIEQTMRLTGPDETVMDFKGEMLYRRRAFYYVLEKITRRAIAAGRIQDTIAADILRTHAMVAVRDGYAFPRDGRAFLLRNFVNAGCVRVAGMMVPQAAPSGSRFRRNTASSLRRVHSRECSMARVMTDREN